MLILTRIQHSSIGSKKKQSIQVVFGVEVHLSLVFIGEGIRKILPISQCIILMVNTLGMLNMVIQKKRFFLKSRGLSFQ